jgi:hypothetical protein
MCTFLVLYSDAIGTEILEVIYESVEGKMHKLVLSYPIGILRIVADEVGGYEAFAEAMNLKRLSMHNTGCASPWVVRCVDDGESSGILLYDGIGIVH